MRGSRRDNAQRQRGLIYALDYSRACRSLQDARGRLSPEIARAYNLIGYQPFSLFEEAKEAVRVSTLYHLAEYHKRIEPCYYSKVVYDTFLNVGLDLFIIGKLESTRQERSRRKRGKAY